MKLRNKKTGEIVDVESLGHADSLKGKFGYQVTLSWKIDEHLDTCKTYNSLAELNEEWEDYEEPKEYWCIDWTGGVNHITVLDDTDEYEENKKEIGNYFETKEEAEKAVEKLKAWKRLRDKGFRFIDHIDRDSGQGMTRYEWDGYVNGEDLDLLFGGEK